MTTKFQATVRKRKNQSLSSRENLSSNFEEFSLKSLIEVSAGELGWNSELN